MQGARVPVTLSGDVLVDRNLFGQPVVRTLVADPAWLFDDELPGGGRGASKHYGCSPVEAFVAMARDFDFEFHRDAFLLMWRVAAMQREALDLIDGWGFEVKTEIVWEKTNADGSPFMGMGHYTRGSHEVCLVATRGAPKMLRRDIRSRFAAPVGEHSAKPDLFYSIVETGFPAPRAELFARARRAGWMQHGNELPAVAAG